jgi:hypothetical protein
MTKRKEYPTINSSLMVYELRPNQLREQDPDPYSMPRSQIRKALQKTGEFEFDYTLTYRGTYRNKKEYLSDSGFHGKNFIKLGCTIFRNSNYHKLKEWALR